MPDLDQLIGRWGYLAIFIVVVLGNVGLPVPEETILILAGYLVWDDTLRLPATLLVGIGSAAAGDNVGYWLGRRYGRRAIERYAHRVWVTPQHLTAMTRFVTRYGGVAVVLARFLPGLRFLGGPLAGAAGMPFPKFGLANLVGAILFVPYAVGLGYAIGYGLGEYVERVRRVAGVVHAWTLLAVVIAGLVLVGRLVVDRLRTSRQA
jgi:membrane protein DedA with SNARE-associated domain